MAFRALGYKAKEGKQVQDEEKSSRQGIQFPFDSNPDTITLDGFFCLQDNAGNLTGEHITLTDHEGSTEIVKVLSSRWTEDGKLQLSVQRGVLNDHL